jgi:hypothetical protein
MLAGRKLPVTPAGSPDAESATGEANPPNPLLVTVTVMLEFFASTALGEPAERLNPGTPTVRFPRCVTLPPAAVIASV